MSIPAAEVFAALSVMHPLQIPVAVSTTRCLKHRAGSVDPRLVLGCSQSPPAEPYLSGAFAVHYFEELDVASDDFRARRKRAPTSLNPESVAGTVTAGSQLAILSDAPSTAQSPRYD